MSNKFNDNNIHITSTITAVVLFTTPNLSALCFNFWISASSTTLSGFDFTPDADLLDDGLLVDELSAIAGLVKLNLSARAFFLSSTGTIPNLAARSAFLSVILGSSVTGVETETGAGAKAGVDLSTEAGAVVVWDEKFADAVKVETAVGWVWDNGTEVGGVIFTWGMETTAAGLGAETAAYFSLIGAGLVEKDSFSVNSFWPVGISDSTVSKPNSSSSSAA